MIWSIARFMPVAAGTIACATAAMCALRLPTHVLPLVMIAVTVPLWLGFRRLSVVSDTSPLTRPEWALLLYAIVVGMVRLVPLIYQYAAGELTGSTTYDDPTHYQELASLLSSANFPPRLNFNPDFYFHFYYLPWIPAAALSEVLWLITGKTFLKVAYGVDTLALGILAAVGLILFLRHVLDARARPWAVLAVFLAGAIPDGLVALRRLSKGVLDHAEQWQQTFGVGNQFSSWTTLQFWVPHHLIAAIALLLVVVLATEPRSLTPRNSVVAGIAAGMMLAFALFSSIFVLIGGAVALSPLALRGRARPGVLAAMGFTAVCVSAPLSYIYLHADAANGFVFAADFWRWRDHFHSIALAFVGPMAALVFMVAEVGWFAGHTLLMTGKSGQRGPLFWPMIASAAYLVSTAFVGFSGANNFAIRGAIVPSIVLVCAWAEAMSRSALPRTRTVRAALAVAIGLALLAHANEFAYLGARSVAAIPYATESDECKRRILALNAGPRYRRADVSALASCRDQSSIYSVEVPFVKAPLTPADNELKGRGP